MESDNVRFKKRKREILIVQYFPPCITKTTLYQSSSGGYTFQVRNTDWIFWKHPENNMRKLISIPLLLSLVEITQASLLLSMNNKESVIRLLLVIFDASQLKGNWDAEMIALEHPAHQCRLI